jgi:hypothetical protein
MYLFNIAATNEAALAERRTLLKQVFGWKTIRISIYIFFASKPFH